MDVIMKWAMYRDGWKMNVNHIKYTEPVFLSHLK